MRYLENPNYDPNALLDEVKHMMRLRTDKELSRAIDIRPCEISFVRTRRRPIGAMMLLALHDLTGLPAKELRKMGGME